MTNFNLCLMGSLLVSYIALTWALITMNRQCGQLEREIENERERAKVKEAEAAHAQLKREQAERITRTMERELEAAKGKHAGLVAKIEALENVIVGLQPKARKRA